mmetsp:Transcript_18841/g.54839  ORF Transcript_18841/g.54839 Transcript_18841/m.54839 type:complete len:134 (-) Transcript_18841:326-727(-)
MGPISEPEVVQEPGPRLLHPFLEGGAQRLGELVSTGVKRSLEQRLWFNLVPAPALLLLPPDPEGCLPTLLLLLPSLFALLLSPAAGRGNDVNGRGGSRKKGRERVMMMVVRQPFQVVRLTPYWHLGVVVPPVG